jgi:nitroimidazol reductase NimA-like FMN-containing flavoprotein (pyridoxamine 5'-phosphate oxidase superfamily)
MTTMQPNEITEVLGRPLSQELLARDLTRLAYVAKDGTPRTIPIAFTWNGSEVVMCTSTNAPKLTSLRHNPAAERGRGADPAAGRTPVRLK